MFGAPTIWSKLFPLGVHLLLRETLARIYREMGSNSPRVHPPRVAHRGDGAIRGLALLRLGHACGSILPWSG